MTLLLTVANETGVHQSSDYRLTDQISGRPCPDEAGAKQLHIHRLDVQLQVSFTGLASLGRWKVIDWIAAELQQWDTDAVGAATRIANRATREFGRLRGPKHELTIVIGAVERHHGVHVFQISNSYRAAGPRTLPRADFDVASYDARRPIHLVRGLEATVTRADRKLLASLARRNAETGAIQAALCSVNVRSATRSKAGVSSDCWVASLWRDGEHIHSSQRNSGSVPGLPPSLSAGFDISRWVRDNVRAAPGKRLTLEQVIAVSGPGKPAPPPEGQARTFHLNIPVASLAFGARDPRDWVQVEGESEVSVRRNETATFVLGRISLQIDSSGTWELERQNVFGMPRLPSIPTCEGLPVSKTWDGFQFSLTAKSGYHALTLLPSSVGIRNVPYLASDEELVFVVPSREIRLECDSSRQLASADVSATVCWRRFPELS